MEGKTEEGQKGKREKGKRDELIGMVAAEVMLK
jgi:hypothetical protein